MAPRMRRQARIVLPGIATFLVIYEVVKRKKIERWWFGQWETEKRGQSNDLVWKPLPSRVHEQTFA